MKSPCFVLRSRFFALAKCQLMSQTEQSDTFSSLFPVYIRTGDELSLEPKARTSAPTAFQLIGHEWNNNSTAIETAI